MRSSWRIGRIFGIDIKVDSSWVVIFILFTWLLAGEYFPRLFPHESRALFWGLGLLTSLLLFASVLAHELMHSVVALKQGERVNNITLFILGGVSQIADEPKKPWQEFSMAVVGPLSSLVLGGLFFGLSRLLRSSSQILAASASYLGLLNVGLGVFNLLPGFPMDGGRVLRSILWKTTGNLRKATRIASLTGQGFAFILIFLGVVQILRGVFGGLWFILIGWFLHHAAVRGYSQVLVKSMLEDVRAKDLMATDYSTVSADLPVQSLVDDHILKNRERVFLVSEGRGQALEGIVCLDDIRAAPRQEWPGVKVRDIMTPRDRLHAVKSDSDGNEVLQSLTEKNVNQVPVMDGERVTGIICRTDFLRYLQLKNELNR
jgi:Zn-dependent protease/predicted transcriptional regulator